MYLLKPINDEWMYGRNKRGCEGIFPISYVDIQVPLCNHVEPDSGSTSRSALIKPDADSYIVRVLYNFYAETENDLPIKVFMNDSIDVKSNDDTCFIEET